MATSKKNVVKVRKTTLIYILLCSILLILVIGYNVIRIKDFNVTDGADWEENSFTGNDSFSGVEEMHFAHMPITYSIDLPEGNYFDVEKSPNYFVKDYNYLVTTMNRDKKIEDIRSAFKIIENNSEGLVRFKEVGKDENPDIYVRGIFPPDFAEILEVKDYNASVDGLLGMGEPHNISNVIVNSTVYLLPLVTTYINEANWVSGRCLSGDKIFPHVEIHEILHALGIAHRFDRIDKVMFPLSLSRCQTTEIDKETLDCLKYIYSNGTTGEGCGDANTFSDDAEDVLNMTFEDFAWHETPIRYSIEGCEENVKDRIGKAILQIEKVLGKKFFSLDEQDYFVRFSCLDYQKENLYNPESDYYLNYYPMLDKNYSYDESGNVEYLDIGIHYHPDCLKGLSANGIDMLAVYRAIGLRNDYGTDMTNLYCGFGGVGVSRNTTSQINKLYGSG